MGGDDSRVAAGSGYATPISLTYWPDVRLAPLAVPEIAARWNSEILLAEFTHNLVTGRMPNSVRGEAAQFRDDFDDTRIFLNNSDLAPSF